MSFSDRMQEELTNAIKARDPLRLSTLRMVKAALQYKEIEKRKPLEEAESLQVLHTLVKQRRESVQQFTLGKRLDLAEKETQEIRIIEAFLPAPASEGEMQQAIAAALAETGATSAKQMGAVMKAARAALSGKTVDGKLLSDKIRERLS